MISKKKLIVIEGPTASGKTEMAVKVSLHFGTEILSADSRQFYREMGIGTAKPSPEELSAVKHYFIDSLSVSQDYSAGEFEAEGLEVLSGIFSQKDTAILVGGSGLFIKAITEGFDDLPKAGPGIRDRLNQLYRTQGLPVLQQQLKELDPDYYLEVDINNPKRMIRALEVCMSTGLPFSSFQLNKKKPRPFGLIKIGLNTHRELLYERINKRVDIMIREGLVDEVKQLLPFRDLNPLKTVGYSEIFEFLDGSISLQQATDLIKQNTRRFAKRQLTWFRKDPGIKWFEPGQTEAVIDHISRNLHL